MENNEELEIINEKFSEIGQRKAAQYIDFLREHFEGMEADAND